ncbi:MAG: helveticin J family class III bacteriocin [Terrisporobacter sp.]
MTKFKDDIYITIRIIIVFILSFVIFTNSIYATVIDNKNIDIVLEFSGLRSGMIIQNFDYASENEIFVTQSKKRHTYLCRCIICKGKAHMMDYIRLANYGHGESIEVIKDKDKTYIWLGNRANESPNPNGKFYYWSQDISRIEYVVDSSCSTGARIGEIKTITNIENISTRPKGLSFRSSLAIADGCNRICFRTQIDNSSRSTYYGVYKLDEINDKLNSTSVTKIDIKNFKKSQVSYLTDLKCPNKSFQGFDITGAGSANKFIYIYGGGEGQTPTIYKYSYTNDGNCNHEKTIKIKGSCVGKLEAEGIKVENNQNIFISFKPPKDNNGKRKPFRVYSFKEN